MDNELLLIATTQSAEFFRVKVDPFCLKCIDDTEQLFDQVRAGNAMRLAFGALLSIVFSKNNVVLYERDAKIHKCESKMRRTTLDHMPAMCRSTGPVISRLKTCK